MRKLSIEEQIWPLKKPFAIARGTRTKTRTLKVSLQEGAFVGVGECVPYARYGESFESVSAQIKALEEALSEGLSRQKLQGMLPAGAARNALDAALWDLEAKLTCRDVGELSGLGWPRNVQTVQTISIGSPQEMGAEAARLKRFAVLKAKLNADDIEDRIESIHKNAPSSKIIVDANESWSVEILARAAPKLASMGVIMIEQPLHADQDEALSDYSGPLPIFADESCHTRADLPGLANKYDGINIKLDKAGGLTEGLALLSAAKKANFQIMLGCMLASSLGMAPAMFLAGQARFVDLDAPALLAGDCKFGLKIEDGMISELNPALWGGVGLASPF